MEIKTWKDVPGSIKSLVVLVVLFVIALISLGVFRAMFVNKVENYQIAYRYDLIGENRGKIIILKNYDGTYRRGWVITPPIVAKVHTVDLRPMQVQMNANSRVLNAKLIQFNPNGLELFLDWHGRNDYEGPGSGSVSSSTNFSEILRSYAYDGNHYPFLNILRELKTEEGVDPLDANTNTVRIDKTPPADNDSTAHPAPTGE